MTSFQTRPRIYSVGERKRDPREKYEAYVRLGALPLNSGRGRQSGRKPRRQRRKLRQTFCDQLWERATGPHLTGTNISALFKGGITLSIRNAPLQRVGQAASGAAPETPRAASSRKLASRLDDLMSTLGGGEAEGEYGLELGDDAEQLLDVSDVTDVDVAKLVDI